MYNLVVTFELKCGITQAYEVAAPKGFLEAIHLEAVGIGANAGVGLLPPDDGDDRCNPERLQQRLSGGAVQTWDELYDAATAAYPTFQQLLEDITTAVGRGTSLVNLLFPPKGHELKSRVRGSQKARDDYSDRSPGPAFGWLFDVVRAALVCETAEVVKQVLAILVADPST